MSSLASENITQHELAEANTRATGTVLEKAIVEDMHYWCETFDPYQLVSL